MMYRNTFRFSPLAVTVALSLFSAFAIAGGFTQKRGEQTEASLMSAANAIPDVEVVLKKKPDPQPAAAPPMKSAAKSGSIAAAAKPRQNRDQQSGGNKKTNKDGSFSFENVPVGTYNLTFDAPKVSPVMAGKVEYLVIVQQVEAEGAANSATITYDTSKPKTARIPLSRIKDGLEFTVGPQPQVGAFQASKPKSKTGAPVTSQVMEPKRSPRAMNLRGKIFLVEIGTTRIVRDESVKAP
jgi:hypothetical protein